MSDPRPPRRVTLADVAREAGVSVQTASHVLSGTAQVRLPEATRQRVIEAARRVRYQPNRMAQAMKRGRSQVIAVWMPLDRPNVNYLRFLQALYPLARRADYDVMISGLETSLALAADGDLPPSWPVDGILSLDAAKALRRHLDAQILAPTPSVVLGYEEYENSDSVAWSVSEAVHSAVGRMIAEGRRRILHVSARWVIDGFPNERRRRGYTEAMEAAGLVPEFAAAETETATAAAAAVEEWIDRHGSPEGIFAFTDTLAMGAARACLDRGLAVPEAVRVWGYGDYPEAEDHRAPISTIRIPIAAVADQAWTWLHERMADPGIPGRQRIIPAELVERPSPTVS